MVLLRWVACQWSEGVTQPRLIANKVRHDINGRFPDVVMEMLPFLGGMHVKVILAVCYDTLHGRGMPNAVMVEDVTCSVFHRYPFELERDDFIQVEHMLDELTEMGFLKRVERGKVVAYAIDFDQEEESRIQGIDPNDLRPSSERPDQNGITPEDRWKVWERDSFTCRRCGSRRHLSIDHIIPRSKGGTNELANYQTLCKRCNSAKGGR